MPDLCDMWEDDTEMSGDGLTEDGLYLDELPFDDGQQYREDIWFGRIQGTKGIGYTDNLLYGL